MNTCLTNYKGKRIILIILATFLAVVILGVVNTYAANVPNASGKVDSKGGAYLREKASASSRKVVLLKNNTNLIIQKEVFTSKSSAKATKKWYYVSAVGKKGYIRSDLVDTVNYSVVKGKTTDSLNYRNGAATSMKKKGTFKKGAKLQVVLNANLNGKSSTWYKVKSGNKYYYVDSKYVQLTTSSSTKSTATTTASAVTQTTGELPTIIISDATYPTSIGLGTTFVLQGTITCDQTIQKIEGGILNANGKWEFCENKTVNAKSFNISNIDSAIKFGKLSKGSYRYRVNVYVNGKCYTKMDYPFSVQAVSGPTLLTNTAISLAWPAGTNSSKYYYTTGAATSAYKKAMDSVFPKHNTWGKYTGAGCSCDVFISTVCRYCGYDTEMPTSLNKQWEAFEDKTKWNRVNYTYKESDLRSGDIFIYKKSNGSQHVCMYVIINGKGYIAEAAYYTSTPEKNKYAFINSSTSKLFKSSDKTKLAVYRACK